ncbi:hypothetical protein CFN78_18360 [Amycolatopsis antarctica]|uniref:DUF6314 domain-containing protein n=1 Tax=Amycolatopsis antarctica TaxID=1854586 RepID=A0A263D040_9PSEU|nr:DUF6314 family protein [Amycolatopsis antarctica]OZM71792.1 hypothetical protein CFN78_18360 [Amycolatopsis antarctica]
MDPFPVTDLESYLGGHWRIDRVIVDAAGAPAGGFTGHAAITPEGDGVLRYRERGTLRLGTHTGEASRTLRYEVTGPGRADVRFEHGGFFHAVDLREGRWRTEHPCAADLYRVAYRVLGPGQWSQEWTVSGPAKDHTIRSAFHRLAGHPGRLRPGGDR